MLRFFTIKDYFNPKPILVDLFFILVLASILLVVKSKNRNKYIFTFSIILTLTCIINSIYYTYYSSYASFSLLATSTAIVDVGDAIIENVLQFKDLIFIWNIILLYIIARDHKKNNYKEPPANKKVAKKVLCIALLIVAITSIFISEGEWSSLTKIWRRKERVTTFGIYTYQLSDLISSLQPGVNNLFGYDQALKKVKDYYHDNKEKKETNEYTNIYKGKNIIVIHAESLQTITMNQAFNGQEVTPNLNKLASTGLFYNNFYSQVGVGTSSDAEFTFSTSLMPSSSGTIFINYYDREYTTIQKLLKAQNYNVYSMHGNKKTFWNRDIMHKNMGYDYFYSEEDYIIDETIGLGLSDQSFFNQSISKIKDISNQGKPYYITLLTLSNHTPFSDLSLMPEYDTNYLNDTPLGNYFRSVHYADYAIGKFIQQLDAEHLLDNTVLVIYGDHDARIDYKYYDMLYNYSKEEERVLGPNDQDYTPYNEYDYQLDKKVPLIIWTKDASHQQTIDTPMGMIDVLPTLGNMLGISSPYQLGHDIMTKEDNTVVFTDGSFLTKKVYYNASKQESYALENTAISDKYLKKRSTYADEIIDISNNITNYDLIKELNTNKK